jgi:hypothetical protein
VSGLAKRDLATCERVIQSGMNTFIAVGVALAEIRDERLYRRTHATFEAYCSERWSFSRQRALQLIDAATVTTVVVTPLTSERQARAIAPLAKSDPDKANEVMAELHAEAEASGESVTAAKIGDRIREIIAPKIDREEVAEASVPPAAITVPPPVVPDGVDPETGEVTPLERFIAEDPDIALAVWRRDFGKAITRPLDLMGYDAAEAAESASDDQATEIARLVANLAAWHAKFTKARPSGLRLVGGNQ